MRKTIIVLSSLAAALGWQVLLAQTASGPGSSSAPRLSPKPPISPAPGLHGGEPPLFEALDVNHDGVIDAKEIAAAPKSLLALDKNKDGKLTAEEYMPARGASLLLAALDANHDQVIDATELSNATMDLRVLDKDHDGKLMPAELHVSKRALSGGASSGVAAGGLGPK